MSKRKIACGLVLLFALLLALTGCGQESKPKREPKTYTYDILSVKRHVKEVTGHMGYKEAHTDICYTFSYMDSENLIYAREFYLCMDNIGLGESNQFVIVDDGEERTYYLYLTEEYLQPDAIVDDLIKGEDSE